MSFYVFALTGMRQASLRSSMEDQVASLARDLTLSSEVIVVLRTACFSCCGCECVCGCNCVGGGWGSDLFFLLLLLLPWPLALTIFVVLLLALCGNMKVSCVSHCSSMPSVQFLAELATWTPCEE